MAEIITSSGFKAEIAEEARDDWELLEAFRAVDKGDVGAIVDVAPIVLGDKQYEELKAHLKKRDGKVKATAMISEIKEIMEGDKEAKNS